MKGKNAIMIISIHQPNFLPWLGYFHKIALSDVFVIFDDVQYPRAKTYGNRVLIKINNGKSWLTVPVLHKAELHKYNEIKIKESNWKRKTLKTIKLSYKNAPYFSKYFDEFSEIYLNNYDSLVEFNYELIKFIADKLKISTEFVLSSDICKDVELQGEEKILFILENLCASDYISGTGEGSKRYIQEDEFRKRNIKLIWQNFVHPVYPQLYGDFISHLSIIDLLFNCGTESREILLGNKLK